MPLPRPDLPRPRGLLAASPLRPLQVAVPLGTLGALVDKMASEEQVVRGRDGERVAHEGRRVNAERKGHRGGDTMYGASLAWWEGQRFAFVGLARGR